MKYVFCFEDVGESESRLVGGKFSSLAALSRSGLPVPRGICISTEAYSAYLASGGLSERIQLELSRKDFDDMRWEEMWDAALRVRNLFLTTPLPADLSEALLKGLNRHFPKTPVVVRSSAPGEDSAQASFAGLHESYVNVRGPQAILEHVKKVWASLWSDAALLYRRELGLDVASSRMAVAVQEIVTGDRSGVAFSQDPDDPSRALLEAVHGLNQGLVDGTVEPDRWVLERASGRVVSHTPARRENWLRPALEGVSLEPLPPGRASRPPLAAKGIQAVFALARQAETLFDAPQDVEWTFRGSRLYVLQSRPITTLAPSDSGDQRSWYLGLRRSFQNLQELRERVENQLIPEMDQDARSLESLDIGGLSDAELAREIEHRKGIHTKWREVYWHDFIPLAHGARLFGQVYNDTVCPADPYEFMDLLGATRMLSLERNRMLEELAARIRRDTQMRQALESGAFSRVDPAFTEALEALHARFGDPSWKGSGGSASRGILGVLLEMAARPAAKGPRRSKDLEKIQQDFLSHFEGSERRRAAGLLDLARASYRLRDDDNIHLGRIEAQVLRALEEGEKRTGERAAGQPGRLEPDEVVAALRDPAYAPPARAVERPAESAFRVKPRQLIGQPAGPGVAEGLARVVVGPADLGGFKSGEILVCDAVDPNMTYVVPLCGGIVERRGGMLIHGAIIAREYGLPCVTGVPEATRLVRTGDPLTVDGYLGIVTVGRPEL